MNEVHNHDSEALQKRKLPSNHLVAVLPSGDAADAGVADLERIGLRDAIVLQGEEAAYAFDAKGEHSDIVSRFFKALQHPLSEELNYLAQYQEEARSGNPVVAVEVHGDDEADAALAVLQRHGARNVRHFRPLAVADLTPETNPSLRSSESADEKSSGSPTRP